MSKDPKAVLALSLVTISVVLVGLGVGLLREADASFVLLALGLPALTFGVMQVGQVRDGGANPFDRTRYLTYVLVLLIAATGLVLLGNGRVPFIAPILETTPGQNVATDLGNALVGGLIVSAVLMFIESAQRRRDDELAVERRRDSQRATDLLLLGLERDLSRVDLSDRDLSWFSLRRRDISRARLRRCCLFRTNLEHCDLTRTEFDDADLTNVFLDDAILTEAKLHRAVLDHAYLRRVSLKGASLYGASLRGAKLDGADLSASDLRAADLRGAILGSAVMDEARFDADTLFDFGVQPESLGMMRDTEGPRSDMLTPTGAAGCGADHDADRQAWKQQQVESARAFRAKLDRRSSEA